MRSRIAIDGDLLVTFDRDARVSLFDLVDMEEELAVILDRKVDWSARKASNAATTTSAGRRYWEAPR